MISIYIVRILLTRALLSDTILVVCKKTRYTNFMHLRAVWTLEGLKPASIADLTVTNLAISSILVTLYAAWCTTFNAIFRFLFTFFAKRTVAVVANNINFLAFCTRYFLTLLTIPDVNTVLTVIFLTSSCKGIWCKFLYSSWCQRDINANSLLTAIIDSILTPWLITHKCITFVTRWRLDTISFSSL